MWPYPVKPGLPESTTGAATISQAPTAAPTAQRSTPLPRRSIAPRSAPRPSTRPSTPTTATCRCGQRRERRVVAEQPRDDHERGQAHGHDEQRRDGRPDRWRDAPARPAPADSTSIRAGNTTQASRKTPITSRGPRGLLHARDRPASCSRRSRMRSPVAAAESRRATSARGSSRPSPRLRRLAEHPAHQLGRMLDAGIGPLALGRVDLAVRAHPTDRVVDQIAVLVVHEVDVPGVAGRR